jgi:hypothetical protein
VSFSQWYKEIGTHILMGVGCQLHELSHRIVLDSTFWYRERISVNYLNYQVDSGDLLLFQGNNWTAKMNQIAQQSDFGKS